MNVFQLPELFQLYPSTTTHTQKEGKKQATGQLETNAVYNTGGRKLPSRTRNQSAGPCLSKSSSSCLEGSPSKEEAVPRHNSNGDWLSLMSQSLQRTQQQAMGMLSMRNSNNAAVHDPLDDRIDVSTKDRGGIDQQEQLREPLPDFISPSKSTGEGSIPSNSDCGEIEIQLTPATTSSQEASESCSEPNESIQQTTSNDENAAALKPGLEEASQAGESAPPTNQTRAEPLLSPNEGSSSESLPVEKETGSLVDRIEVDQEVEIQLTPTMSLDETLTPEEDESLPVEKETGSLVERLEEDQEVEMQLTPTRSLDEQLTTEEEGDDSAPFSEPLTTDEEVQACLKADSARADQGEDIQPSATESEGKMMLPGETASEQGSAGHARASESDLNEDQEIEVQLTATQSQEESASEPYGSLSQEGASSEQATLSSDSNDDVEVEVSLSALVSQDDESSKVELDPEELARMMEAYTLQNQRSGGTPTGTSDSRALNTPKAERQEENKELQEEMEITLSQDRELNGLETVDTLSSTLTEETSEVQLSDREFLRTKGQFAQEKDAPVDHASTGVFSNRECDTMSDSKKVELPHERVDGKQVLGQTVSASLTEESSELEVDAKALARIMTAYAQQGQEPKEQKQEMSPDIPNHIQLISQKTNNLEGQGPTSQDWENHDREQDEYPKIAAALTSESSKVQMNDKELTSLMDAYTLQTGAQETSEDFTNIKSQEVLDSSTNGDKDAIITANLTDESSEIQVDARELAKIMNAYALRQDANESYGNAIVPALADLGKKKSQNEGQVILASTSTNMPKEGHMDAEEPATDDGDQEKAKLEAVVPQVERSHCIQNENASLAATSTDESSKVEMDAGDLARIMNVYSLQQGTEKPRKADEVTTHEELEMNDGSQHEDPIMSAAASTNMFNKGKEDAEEGNDVLQSDGERGNDQLEVATLPISEFCHNIQNKDAALAANSTDDSSKLEKDAKEFEGVIESSTLQQDPREESNVDLEDFNTEKSQVNSESKPVIAPSEQFLPSLDTASALIRELKHVQTHGPRFFEAIDKKIHLWQQEETQFQQQRTVSLKKQEIPQRIQDDADRVSRTGTELHKEVDNEAVQVTRIKPPMLIRELQHIQCHGPDMLEAIEEKVKLWQHHETKQDREADGAEDCLKSIPSDNSQVGSSDGSFKLRQGKNVVPASAEHTECTLSCTASASSSRKSAGRSEGKLVDKASADSELKKSASESNRSEELNSSPSSCGESDSGEWNAPACMAALVDQALEDAAVSTAKPAIATGCDDGTVDWTLGSDVIEWAVVNSFDEFSGHGEYQYFDFEDLSIEDGEEYGIVGHGVSDAVSTISELSIPTVVSHCTKDVVPAPTVILRHVSPRQPKSFFQSSIFKPRPMLRRTETAQRDRPARLLAFQKANLRRVKSNPTRLPQMRYAALLCLYRQNLKPVQTADQASKPHSESDEPWRILRRCNSDEPTSDTWFVKARSDDSASVKFVSSKWGRGKCILDFSWDELDEVVSINKKAVAGSFDDDIESVSDGSAIVEEMTLESSYEEETVFDGADEITAEEVAPRPERPLGTTAIEKTNSYYDSVSVSFLASSIGDNVIINVMDEAMRILRPGGVLNVLDANGTVLGRVQQFPRFQALVFNRATDTDQERVETNTMTILEKSGLKAAVNINDPRLVHWTATKPEEASAATTEKDQDSVLLVSSQRIEKQRLALA